MGTLLLPLSSLLRSYHTCAEWHTIPALRSIISECHPDVSPIPSACAALCCVLCWDRAKPLVTKRQQARGAALPGQDSVLCPGTVFSWDCVPDKYSILALRDPEVPCRHPAILLGLQVSATVSHKEEPAAGRRADGRMSSAELPVQPGWRSWQVLKTSFRQNMILTAPGRGLGTPEGHKQVCTQSPHRGPWLADSSGAGHFTKSGQGQGLPPEGQWEV